METFQVGMDAYQADMEAFRVGMEAYHGDMEANLV
jgi:hypothetical protein